MATRTLTDTARIAWAETPAGVVSADIVADSVSNTLLANMAQGTIQGRAAGAGTGDPTPLTAAQVSTILGLPTTSVDNTIIRADGTAGAFQGSGIVIDDSNNIAMPAGTGISSSSGAVSINGTPFSASVQATGLNGIDGDQFFIYKEYTAALGGAGHPSGETAVLRVQRSANYTGGTPGNVEAGLWVPVTVAAGVANFEWGILSQMTNNATGGQNVAIYAQITKNSTGPSWGNVSEVIETTGANPSSGSVGFEIDMTANGTDTSGNRIGLDIVAQTYLVGTLPTIGHGIRIGPENGVAANGQFDNGITLLGNFAVGLNLANAACTTADIITAGNVGFGFSATPGQVARRLHSKVFDAVTAATTYVARLTHATSGTAANGFGVGLEAELENASGTNRVVGALDWTFTDATNATEDADLLIKLMTAGAAAATVARFKSTGFFGVNCDPAVALDVLATGSNAQMRISDGTVDNRFIANVASGCLIGSFSAHDPVIVRNGVEVFRGDSAGLNLASGKVIKVNSVQVVSSQGAAVANATDPASVIARLNDLLARLRTHGLIAT